MLKNLRHLRALQIFDETANHFSLTQAAFTLNVTHGAVSRQIKLLEEHLDIALFYRRAQGVELTEAGRLLHQSTREAFTKLQAGVSDVRFQHHRQSLVVSLSTSLAVKWLVPQLSSFQNKHPDIALQLDTNDSLVDFDTNEVDVALRFWGTNLGGTVP